MEKERGREFGYSVVGLSRFAWGRVAIKGKVICLCGEELCVNTRRRGNESPSTLHGGRAAPAFLVPGAGDMK